MTGSPPDADPEDVFGRPPAGWGDLERLADDLWAGSELADEYPRAIDRIAVMRLPLFLVDLPAVSVGHVRRWLALHRLPDGRAGPDNRPVAARLESTSHPDVPGPADRDLMGCLYAHGGHGYAFVGAADPPAERRLTVAHEVAHFLLDYLRPRRRVLAALGPAAADVLDGRRPATIAERAAAVLAHVRVGPHLHLLDRGDDGGESREPDEGSGDDPVIAAAERRADALAVELVAPRARVAERLWIARARDGHGNPRMRIGFGPDAPGRHRGGPSPPDPSAPDADAVAAELAAFFGLPSYALARYLRPRPVPRRSPLLDAARAAIDRAKWQRETDPS